MNVRRTAQRLTRFAALAALAALLGCAHSSEASSEAAVAPAVATVRARAGSVANTISVTGRIGPPAGSDAKLAFPIAGVVDEVVVRPGDAVVAGETLATLDRRALGDALAQARADANAAAATYAGGTTASAAAASAQAKVDVAQARLDALRAGGPGASSDRISAVSAARQAALKVELDRGALERTTTLYGGGVAAAKDVDAARSLLASDLADERSADAKVDAATAGYASALRQASADAAAAASDLAAARAGVGSATAQRDAALARLASAQTDYARGVLGAPSAGIVVAVFKHPGEAVDATTPVLDVAPPENGQVTLTLPSNDAARVAIGDPVRLVVTATGAVTQAHVAAVVPAVDSTTQTVTVVARGDMRRGVAGEAVDATIVLGRTSGVVVPSSAIVTDPQTGKSVVFVRNRASKDAPYDSHTVGVRANDGTMAVVSGVRSGDEIASQGAYDLLAPNGG